MADREADSSVKHSASSFGLGCSSGLATAPRLTARIFRQRRETGVAESSEAHQASQCSSFT